MKGSFPLRLFGFLLLQFLVSCIGPPKFGVPELMIEVWKVAGAPDSSKLPHKGDWFRA